MTPPATKTTPRSRAGAEAPAEPERAQRADARRNREAILAAARERFAELGMECQMDDIAKAAGVGVGTVYRHFPTKDELVAALVHERFAKLAERAEQALAEEDPWQAFCEFMRWSAEFQACDRSLSEYLSTEPRLGHRAAMETGLADRTAKLIAKAKRSGGMRKDAAFQDVPTLICGLGAVTGAHPESMPALNWRRFLELVLDGLRATSGSEKLPPPRGPIGD
jgi:AcrR family transcriptional regulator